MSIEKAGHTDVSAVAKPVVVQIVTTWKKAILRASNQFFSIPICTRFRDIARVHITIEIRKNLITGDLNILVECAITKAYMSPKWRPEMMVNIFTTISILKESKAIKEAFLVLNPPVATILNAWLTASNGVMPARHSDTNARMVMPRYTERIILMSSLVLYL